ncbi:YveK family protein [Neobacillus sp. C211]|jgi:capsular polysaccharide biosynthesis protein|uniref:YveK family protein n=1 Tax=unclassified Neobacillus TaxID=2675272 RepID=UPI00397E3F69
MDERIDLKKFLRIIRKRIVTIILTVICVSLLTVGLSLFLLKPTYEATENILIGKLTKEEGNYSDTQELSMLLASTIDFIKSPIVLNSVKKELNINDDELEKKIVVQNNRNSQIINVVVRDHDLESTKKLAHTIAKTSVNKMYELFNVKDIKLLSDTDGDPSIKIVGSLSLNVAIGAVIGIFLGVGLAMFREYWDDSIKDVKEIEGIVGLPVLGQINLKNSKRKFMNKNNRKQQSAVLNDNKRGQISV